MMIGAYTTSVLLTWHPDLPLILVLLASIATTGIAGAIVGIAGARLRGPYLAGATLALAVALPQVPSHFASVFGGNQGLSVPTPTPPAFLGAISLRSSGSRGSPSPRRVITFFVLANLVRSATGKALSDGARQRGGGAAVGHRCRADAGARLRDQRGVRGPRGIAVRVLGDRHIAERIHAQPVAVTAHRGRHRRSRQPQRRRARLVHPRVPAGVDRRLCQQPQPLEQRGQQRAARDLRDRAHRGDPRVPARHRRRVASIARGATRALVSSRGTTVRCPPHRRPRLNDSSNRNPSHTRSTRMRPEISRSRTWAVAAVGRGGSAADRGLRQRQRPRPTRRRRRGSRRPR